jgi:hypothetical protein
MENQILQECDRFLPCFTKIEKILNFLKINGFFSDFVHVKNVLGGRNHLLLKAWLFPSLRKSQDQAQN